MSSKAGLRNKEREGFIKGFKGELGIMKTNKIRYFHMKFNQLIKIAESGYLGVSKDELKALMKDYIDNDKKAEV